MQGQHKFSRKHIVTATTSLLSAWVIVAIVYANEARKEVIYLCANFQAGSTEFEVRSQLETAELSRYDSHKNPTGNTLVFYSPLNFGLYQCTIEFDSNGIVTKSKLQ